MTTKSLMETRAPDVLPPLEVGAAAGLGAQSLDVRTLLHRRLRIIVLVPLLSVSFFNVLRFARYEMTQAIIWRLVVPGAAITLVLALLTLALWRMRPYTLAQLRAFEALLFGLLTVYFVGETYTPLFVNPALALSYAQRHPTELSILARQPSILWVVLIIGYGTFVPNTGRRCAVVCGVMVLAAVTTVAAGGRLHHVPARPPSQLLIEMTMWMAVAMAIATFGSQKITTLREEALAARKLGQYQLKKRLGQGGMGEVYLAEHMLLRRPCAVKVIRAERAGDPAMLRRFLREVQAAATLTHPNTIQVFDYGQAADGTFFYAMEHLTGLSLEQFVVEQGPFPPARAIFVMRQLCGALAEAHAIGLIHRDIKPSNVILCNRGGVHDVAKLLDFGLVRTQLADARDAGLTQAGVIFGTPDYMSPEQAAGQTDLDGRSDMYSLGALAYFLLTSEAPFVRATVAQTLAAHIEDPVVALRSLDKTLPEDLDAVVLRCLAKRPADRFADMAALDQALALCGDAERWTQAQARALWRVECANDLNAAHDRPI